MANHYLADISIVNPKSESDYCVRNVVVVESGLFLTSGIHALLRRNVLEHCLFSYNGVL